MEINVISIFPEMFGLVNDFGVCKQGISRGVFRLNTINPRDFASDKHRSVDDRPYGGGPGMLMKPEPLARAIDSIKESYKGPVIYLSPQGKKLEQTKVKQLSQYGDLTLLAGRYEGIDERVIESRVDEEISIGDYVLSGGEFAVMVMIDAIVRLLPGVLGNENSALQDSFSENFLDCPHYTRPEVFENRRVPAVLMQGDHGEIEKWRLKQSIYKTRVLRPDLFTKARENLVDF